MSKHYDVVVIGGGPGGYVAAIRAAQQGKSVACVEKWTRKGEQSLGGTCLNVGCIPSKALLESSEKFHLLTHEFASHGISATDPKIDVAKMIERKDGVVDALTGGIKMLFKANKIDSYYGHGKVIAAKTVEVTDSQTQSVVETITADNIILASGSVPVELPFLPFDHEAIVDSSGALCFDKVPEKLVIIGAGVIGLELGSVWRRLGSEVVVLEAMDSFLAAADGAVAKDAARQFKKQGIDIRLSAKVTGAKRQGDKVHVSFTGKKGDEVLEADKLIVAVGRKPYTQNLVDESLGLALNERGFIQVNEKWQTNVDGIYAVGDATPGPMLAHKASEEGIAVADVICGKFGHVNYKAVPWVIYTDPEIAWAGETEEALKEQGIAYKVGQFPFAAAGRARASGNIQGFVKVIAREDTDCVLGVHIIGPHASELIAQAVIAIEFEASSEDLARTIYAHPTLSEAVHEAALAVDKKAIHKAN